ncbi:MAG: tetratricopeptide repeat protein, partial [Bacteroidota bacterium]
EDYTEYIFTDRKTFNILQLPFYEKESCESGDQNLAESIENRLQLFSDVNTYVDTDFRYKKMENIDCPPSFGAVKDAINRTNADLAIWGEFANEEDSSKINFQYLYTTRSDTVTQGSLELRVDPEALDEENNFVHAAIEDVVYWVRGMGHFERREYEDAVKYFSLIQVKEDESYIKIDSRLAKCFIFLKDYDKARDNYDHILRIDPDNYKAYNERGYINAQPRVRQQEAAENDFNEAIRLKPDYTEAYYNRGLLYYNMKRYGEAIADMEVVLELSDRQYDLARTYGVLAAIYADRKERDLFYEKLEIALKNGLKIDKYVYFYSAFRTYRNEPEFKALDQKYR